ncbi:MAG: AMP-binding protein, partial [Acidimicrobiales bacterium]
MFPGTHAQTTPDKTAIVMAGSGETMSFAELHEYAEKLANLFWEAGFEPGDHIALSLENRIEFLPVCWGAHYAGLYYTAISTRLTAAEMAYIVNDSGARSLIVSSELAGVAAEITDLIGAVELRLCLGGPVDGYQRLEPLLDTQPTVPLGPRREGTDMLYSSGTTGQPKGVKVGLVDTELGEPDNVTNLLSLLFGATSESTYLSPAPLYHAAPLRFCRAMNRMGATVVVMERFDAELMLSAIEEHSATFTQVVPTMFVRALKLDEQVRQRYDVSSLECVVHAAAPCPVPVKHQMIEWWG